MGVAATDRIVASVRRKAQRGDDLLPLVRAEILSILEGAAPLPVTGAHPRVILIVGVNGTGKTTSIGKLANLLKQEGQKPLVCAADTFRAAAVEQLEIWTKRADVGFVRAQPNSDPAAVVFDAIQAAKARHLDPVLVDTAGRLHTRVNLMNELDKIKRVAAREVEGAPHEVLLVLDATVGQNGVQQAREFMKVSGVNGIILTKLDGTAKGGVAVAIAQDLRPADPLRRHWANRSTTSCRSIHASTWTRSSRRRGRPTRGRGRTPAGGCPLHGASALAR